MLTPVYRGSFIKDPKLMEKRGKDVAKAEEITALIVSEQPLPRRCRPHALHGDWAGYTECHIEPDWVLVYRIYPAEREIVFDRTGAHSDLFKK